ncbi:hypothetical protein P5673_032331 [Acropora cervicornis]|uniref:C2H2-type domain-containing protein n=1 Tax=Acropora cervicornis TaxID=6130 RepID=A0AAD9PRE0_ACRCE|nr:hypothetical protein P5673_032331 [Acropora cervicornis]
MADTNDLVFFGDDFDAILGILEEEEELDEQFRQAADQVQLENVMCELCQKKCKSKNGLKRHKTVKHKDTREDVENQKELSAYTYNNGLQEITAEFCDIEDLYKRLIKSGNAERFYSCFYSTKALNAVKYFKGLSRNAATLLSTKVADCMLAHSKEKIESIYTCTPLTKLSDEEKAGLQYIGDYVLHKLHTKHAGKSSESEQAISILKAGKLEDQNAIECQKLTSCLNRGGLWAISKNAQLIFERTEHYFRDATSKANVQNIAFANIISRSVHDVEVVSAYNSMLSNSELIINSSVAKDVLHNIIQLYVKVRSFSFAKDIIQKHKIRLKQMKSKALRKDISRASHESDQQRQN